MDKFSLLVKSGFPPGIEGLRPADSLLRAIQERFIVIDREDLPKVETYRDGLSVDGVCYFQLTLDQATKKALIFLAIAEHRAAPPVDHQQVSAIVEAAQSAGMEIPPNTAAELYRAGVRVP